MREIKFRAWDNKNRKMSFSFGLGDACCFPGMIILKPHKNRERFIIMQYTGLIDKNGVEIYEGDLLQGCFDILTNDIEYEDEERKGHPTISKGSITILEVVYKKCSFYGIVQGWIEKDGFKKAIIFQGDPLGEIYNKIDKVIGNIYENPDLLEEK